MSKPAPSEPTKPAPLPKFIESWTVVSGVALNAVSGTVPSGKDGQFSHFDLTLEIDDVRELPSALGVEGFDVYFDPKTKTASDIARPVAMALFAKLTERLAPKAD